MFTRPQFLSFRFCTKMEIFGTCCIGCLLLCTFLACGQDMHPVNAGNEKNSKGSRDSLALPTLAYIWLPSTQVGISGFVHGLIFYGLGPTDLASYKSGTQLFDALTDERRAI